ncbi:MAG: DNA-directed DNA polymerase II small subunit [archaeon]
MKQEIISYAKEKNKILTQSAVDYLETLEDWKTHLDIIAPKIDKLMIDKEDLEKTFEKVKVFRKSSEDIKKEYSPKVKIIKDVDNSGRTGKIEDFYGYFEDRYMKIYEIFRGRLNSIIKIGVLKNMKNTECNIVGMVSEKNVTKNGHIIIKVEDPSGSINVLISKTNQELIRLGEKILLDDVLCFSGKYSGDLFIANKIYFPDVKVKDFKRIQENLAIGFLSDLHVGSSLFLKDEFRAFLEWIKKEEDAKNIKYLVIAGDLVDGIGIYPKQEDELEIADIYEQYSTLWKYILDIPETIQIIIGPGNHDVGGIADPQEKLPPEVIEEIKGYSNIHFVGSPAFLEVEGFKILMYHGTSIDTYISDCPGLDYLNATKPMVEMLKRRRLFGSFGKKPIFPTKEDYGVIKNEPDIFVSGHIHRVGFERYKGIYCINSGTWQDITPYQISQGHTPTPGVFTWLELNTGKLNTKNFREAI